MMKKMLIALLLSTTGFCYEVIEDKSNLKIETPALSHRETRKIRLENGLEALLISDPDTKESGAALAVAVGSWDDPVDRPGMAHFVEHMLFLGTEKYPEEEGYKRYLDEHGGTPNAFTMADRTVYIFSVNNEGFSEALDRFGQFFIAPIFSPSGVDRECKAIHQEFCKDVPLDPWRVLYVKKELANSKHPFHRFCIGNSDTLERISQDELKEWYNTHYSADLMHLVVYSSESLDSLENEVATIFSNVKKKECLPSSSTEPLFLADKFGKMVLITPIQDLQILEMSWELPRVFGKDLEIHADKLVSHILGHEGTSSLLAQLKRENLAESISSGSFNAGKDQSLFTLSIQLTSKGVEEYETVIERCFQTIASLREVGIPRYIFDEVVELQELKYRFQSREEIFELVSDLAMQLVDEPIESFPRRTLFPSKYDPEKIRELVEHLTPHRCQFTLVAPPHLTKQKTTAKEKWMGVNYSVKEIKKEKLDKWAVAKPHFHVAIPRPNPFLPESITVKGNPSEEKTLPRPALVTDSPKGKLYACQDDRYLVPEISWTFTIKTPALSPADPVGLALADLYCLSVNERLNSIAYEAKIAGLSFTLTPCQNGIELKLIGYSDKSAALLDSVLAAMQLPPPSREQFAVYQDQLMRDYLNRANATPLKQGSELLWSILYKEYASLNERSEALKRIQPEQLDAFCSKLFEETYVEGMLYGNGPTLSVWETFEKYLPGKPFHPTRHPKKELASLPCNGHPSYLVLKSQHPANALILTADCGDFTFKKRAAQEILSKGLEEPFFSELRTRQQTAYLVANWSQELERHLYSFFAIQSSSHDTRDLLSRFELFLESSIQHLHQDVIPEERFKAIQSALVYKLEHPAENLHKMGGILHMLAFEYEGAFDWLERRKEAIRELTYVEFLDYAREFLGKQNLRRLALFVNGTLPANGQLSYKEVTTPEKIRNEISYKGRENPSLVTELD
ncbi:MAG: insulinase family protein [Chlamydiales bacterium]|nr:insulinase family protein [Chlamydiales bacterium]